MTRKNESRLLPKKVHSYGAKAKAAIVAGTMAFALLPTPAFATPPQMGSEQGQPGMEQPAQGVDGMNMQEPSFEQQGWQGGPRFNMQDSMPMEENGGQTNGFEQPPAAPENAGEQQDWNERQQGEGPQQGEGSQEQGTAPQQGEQAPAIPDNEGDRQGEEGQQQGSRPSTMPENKDGQQPFGGESRPDGNPGTMMKSFIQKFVNMLGLKIDDAKIDEFLQSVKPQQVASQGFGGQENHPDMPGNDSGQQMGQPGQQMGQPGQPNNQGSQQAGQPGNQGGWQSGSQNANSGGQLSGGQQPNMPAYHQSGQVGQSGQNGSQPGQPGGQNSQQPGGMSNAPTAYDAANSLTQNGSANE